MRARCPSVLTLIAGSQGASGGMDTYTGFPGVSLVVAGTFPSMLTCGVSSDGGVPTAASGLWVRWCASAGSSRVSLIDVGTSCSIFMSGKDD